MFQFAEKDDRKKEGALQRKAPQKENRTGIPARLKERIEGGTGVSLDDVRVHYNSDRPAKLDALAYTRGSQVEIAPGQERHLAHELGHVVQQKLGAVRANARHRSGVAMNTDVMLERQADEIGAGKRVAIVQRMLGGRAQGSSAPPKPVPPRPAFFGAEQKKQPPPPPPRPPIPVDGLSFPPFGIYHKNRPHFGATRVLSMHAQQRMAERGLNEEKIDEVIQNGEVFDSNEDPQTGAKRDAYMYVTKDAIVVLSKDNTVITVYGKNEFTPTIQEGVEMLFGKKKG